MIHATNNRFDIELIKKTSAKKLILLSRIGIDS